MAKSKANFDATMSWHDGATRIDQGQYFGGTAIVYGATVDDHCCFQCDFELDAQRETYPEQTRAWRLRSADKRLPRITDEQLKHEVVLLFGPEMSAADAVKALHRLASEIEQHGLLIGRDENEDFLNEKIDGSVV